MESRASDLKLGSPPCLGGRALLVALATGLALAPGTAQAHGALPALPVTLQQGVEVFEASGKATLFSYVINHRPPKGFEDEAPYAIAVVELEEGPRMMTNITECEQTPEALELDMALEVVFEDISDEISLPKFRPAKG